MNATIVQRTITLEFIVRRTISVPDQRPLRFVTKGIIMTTTEENQQHGKEQLDAAVAAASSFHEGVQAIAVAFADYTRKSVEDGNAFTEKLAGAKSLDQAVAAQTEYARTAYETFVNESQKIGGLYADLAKQAYKPLEDFTAKFVPAAR
jgi:phasin family protein